MRVTLSLCAWLVLAAGCKSAAEKCNTARDAAEAGWTSYVAALDEAGKRARATQIEAQHALSGAVEQRLAPSAQKAADARYPRSSEAWLRAYQSAYTDVCAKDTECNQLRQSVSDAKIMLEDLTDRVPLARAALAAARADAEQARAAAKAVIGHPEFAQYPEAQTRSIAAYKACKDVPPSPP